MSLPRVDSRTLLQDPSPLSPPMSPHLAQFVAALHPRKPKQRSTFIALVALVCLTTYIFIAHSADFSTSISMREPNSAAAEQLAMALETIQNSHMTDISKKQRMKAHHRISLRLNPQEELAAVSSFLASLPQNVIPHTVDPLVPIDPQLVLDFDTRNSRAKEELQVIIEDVWHRNPVFLYSKYFSPQSREVKALLSNLYLKPAPTIIDVDVRDDADTLAPMLKRLTSTSELPVLIIGGVPILKSVEELSEMEKSGELQQLITAAGSQVNGAKKKKHRK